ncbi:MAG: glycine--tRNA ligase subunit beta, partial [Acidiferrobacterales bacterium]
MAARKTKIKKSIRTRAKPKSKKSVAKKAFAPLLVEIGTEELPPRSLKKLSDAFTRLLTEQLLKAGLVNENTAAPKSFATPRRLAALFPKVLNKQPDRENFKKGPAIQAAFDDDGTPTKAAQGFARGLKITPDKLEQRDDHVGLLIKTRGRQAKEIVPEILEQVVKQLPIPKRMRWGDLDA